MLPAASKPRFRGLLHQYAFLGSLPAFGILLLASPPGRATFAATIYGISLVALFGVSALFHRVTWSARTRRWMGRLDHAVINLFIAGTFTPIGLLVLSGTLATVSMVLVWGGALAATLLHVVWIDAPKGLSAVIYVVLGSSAAAAFPQLVSDVGWVPTALLSLGGLLYWAGAAVYALRRPDPAPAVFGYHEVFHALVIVAAVTHYAVFALYVLPRA
jgi:hemolysin III